jgi:predicted HTH domain antitoxin
MKIIVQLPDDVALRPDSGREVLEAFAIELAVLTHYQAGRLLDMSRFEFDALLKSRHIEEHTYDVEDLRRDLATLEHLETIGRMPRRDRRARHLTAPLPRSERP